MTIFWILAAGLIGLALLFVLPPLLGKRRQTEDVDQDELNLAVFRQQLQELDADLAAGKLEEHQYKAARRDLERELLYDVVDGGTENDRETRTSKGNGYFFDAVAGVATVLALLAGISFVESTGMAANTQDAMRDLLSGKSGKVLIGVAFVIGMSLRRLLSRVAVLRRLFGDRRTVAVLFSVGIPTLVVALYLNLGDPSIIPRLEATAGGRASAANPAQGGKMPSLEVMVQRLADKLEKTPNNQEGWLMLGRSYFAIGQPERALYALKRAYGLGAGNPEVLVAYAEAIAAINKGKLAGRPAELIQEALKIDPENVNARWLAGLASFQEARYKQAAEQWESLRMTFDPKSDEAAELGRNIAEARSRAGQAESVQASNTSGTTDAEPTSAQAKDNEGTTNGKSAAPSATNGAIRVEVSLAGSLEHKVDKDESVFIYAKASSGPPMPLAARRARVSDLPINLTLDDSMSMIPSMKLSNFNEVTVGARISKSGQAMPQSGDLEGDISPVEPGQNETVKILIDRVRP